MKIRLIISFAFFTLFFANSVSVLAQEKLTCIGSDVYGNNRRLSRTEVEMSMKTQPECLSMYQGGKSMRGKGNALLISGIVAAPIGLIVMAVGAAESVNSSYDAYSGTYSTTTTSGTYYAGVFLFTFGNVAIAGGITLKMVGKNKIRRSVGMYNTSGNIETSELPDKYNLSIGFRPNGLGAILRF